MIESNQDRLLEIYKLHADLADKVSQRREGANRLHVTLQVGIVMFLAALLRFGTGSTPEHVFWGGAGIIGLLQTIVWLMTIWSYRKLNSRKFRVLQELETRLDFQFFEREDSAESPPRQNRRLRSLTSVEIFTPMVFSMLWATIIGYSIYLRWCS